MLPALPLLVAFPTQVWLPDLLPPQPRSLAPTTAMLLPMVPHPTYPDTSYAEAIRVDAARDGLISYWHGTSQYTDGAAHTVNALTCGVWSVASGAPVTLQGLLGPKEAKRRLSALVARATALAEDSQIDASSLPGLRDTSASTPTILRRGAALFLCTEPIYAESGSTWVWPLEG